jgi:hypothetical protein
MRWSLRLAEFDFDVERRAATQIKHVDALIRPVQTVTTDEFISKELVREEPKTDNFVTPKR